MSLLAPPLVSAYHLSTPRSWADGAALLHDLPAPLSLDWYRVEGLSLARLRLPVGGGEGQFVAIATAASISDLAANAVALASAAGALLFPESPVVERLLLFGIAEDGALWIPVDWLGAYDSTTFIVRSVGQPLPTDARAVAELVRTVAERAR